MNCFGRVITLASILGLSAAPVWAQQEKTVVFQNGLNEYQGTQDTFVMSGDRDRNTNFENNPDGNRFQLEWDGRDRGGRNIALFKFDDLTGEGPNQIPPDAEIVSAVLETTVANNGSGNQSSSIHNLLVEWDQETATFNNVFGDTEMGADPEVGVYVSETFVTAQHSPSNTGQTWKVDLKELVQDIVNGSPNNGFAIIPNSDATNGFGHVSSEAPRLESETVLTIQTTGGTFAFEEGENGYTGVRDAWIGNDGNQYFRNFGDQNLLALSRDAADDVSLGLLRFDNIIGSGVNQVPPMSTVMEANLRLWAREGGDEAIFVNEILPFETEILGVEINTLFDEATVTFENFVEDGVYPQPGVEMSEVPIQAVIPEGFTPIDIDVTDSVRKWVMDEAPNYGWLLEPSSDDDISLTAKEGGDGFGPPKLVVTYLSDTRVGDFMLY